ncbi:MAG: pyridoxal phosphate-dependent aminotransferase [Magnetococcales bacterium]|nr:pyridoxal phosphate-dependent aminotransferase [Magnetococcales bacterium]
MALLSQRIQKVKPSATLQITAKAKEMRAAGQDVIGLGAGEPDFDTPDHIKKAAVKALKDGFTKYTAVGGIPELKSAIIKKYKKDNNLKYEADQIVVTVGGKQAFYNMAQAMLDAGDEVIIPAPYWVSYPDMVLLADATPVIVETKEDNGLKMVPEELKKALTKNTKMVVINSPSNPTGSAYTADELFALGEVLKDYPNVYVVSDDIYERIVYDDFEHFTFAEACPELKDRAIILNGVAKAYSMTGWRIGYAAGPVEIIKAMTKIQSQSTSCATSFAQVAAATAIGGSQKCIKPMVKAFRKRRDFVVKTLNNIPGITCLTPEGAFYVYPNVGGLIGKKTADGKVIENTIDLAAYLLESKGVALVPGSAFGLDPYVRISFATSMADLKEALKRINSVAKELVGK